MLGVFLDFPNSPETPWHSGCVHLPLASEMFPSERSHRQRQADPAEQQSESRVLPLPRDELLRGSPWGLTLWFPQNVRACVCGGGDDVWAPRVKIGFASSVPDNGIPADLVPPSVIPANGPPPGTGYHPARALPLLISQ